MNQFVELTAFRGQPVWELLAAQYLFMIQAGAWALLVGLASRAFGLAGLEKLRPWGILAGTGLALAAPLNLVAELLSPGRFATMLYRFNPSSPLSWGVVAISVLILFGLANCMALFRPERFPARALARLGSLAALGVLVYTWADLGMAAGIALWRTSWATATLASSGLASAMCIILGLDRLARGSAAQGFLPRALAAMGAGTAGVALMVWGATDNWPATPGWLVGSALLAGAGFALILAVYCFLRSPGACFWWACLLALGGSLAARLGLLLTGQVGVLGRNLGEPHLLGHADLPLTLAPVALWVCMMFMASIAANRFPAVVVQTGGRS